MKRFEEPLRQMKEHAKADRFIQGVWTNSEKEGGEFYKGCMFGCTMQTDEDAIEKFCDKWDMPLWMGRVCEEIFECLPINDAKTFPVEVMEKLVALPDDFDLYNVEFAGYGTYVGEKSPFLSALEV